MRHGVADEVTRLPDLPGEGPAGLHDVGPAGNGGVGQRVHHGLGHAGRGEPAQELEPVVGPDLDAEARDIAPTAARSAAGTTP